MKRNLLLLLCINTLLGACSRKTAAEDQARADERRQVEQENHEARTPKARTVAAWKALQNADDAAHDPDLPKVDFSNLLFYRPAITSARKVAQLYAQVDTDGVDSLLISHIDDAITAYREYASSLQETYTDLRTLALATAKNAAASRRLGEFLSEENQKSSGGDVAEFLYRLATDADFGKQRDAILDKHNDEIYNASEKCRSVSIDAANLGQTLGEKYTAHLTSREMPKTYRPHQFTLRGRQSEALRRLEERRRELEAQSAPNATADPGISLRKPKKAGIIPLKKWSQTPQAVTH